MSQVFQVANVDEAIKLATQFKNERKYRYFRGQADASWKVISTYARKNFSQEQQLDHRKSLVRFFDFCESHDSLAYLLKAEYADHSFAIMQHYGMPTHYIDFTRDPAVAAFFATDGDNIKQGQSACIICLSQQNIDRVNSLFDHARLNNSNLPGDFLIEIDVSNLWRLQAQQGVFLFLPDPGIEKYVTFDKIVFPYTGPVAHPPKEMIYPVRKSALEMLLDSYFDNEQKLVSGRLFKKLFEELSANNPNASYTEADDPLDTMHNNLKPGAKPHPSWTDNEKKKWRSRKTETWHDVQSPYCFELNAAIFNDDPLVACTRLCVQLETEMEKGALSRNHLVNFSLKGELDFEEEVKRFLFHCMKVCWDGMRMLPYTDEEIATSLSNLALIFINAYQAGLKTRVYGSEDKTELYRYLLMEDHFMIEMAGRGRGDSSRAMVSRYYLSEAFREDLVNVVVQEHRKLCQFRYDNAKLVLQLILDPEWLFEFDKLKELFVKEIIPTQVYLRANNDKNPIFFTPVQLTALGLP
jgi:hypothetical protein